MQLLKPLPKIFGFCNTRCPQFGKPVVGIAIAEDGMMLAGQVSENIEFLIHDLGLDGISRLYHDVYNEYYPDGWSGEFIEPARFKSVGILQNAIAICESRKRQGKDYRYIKRGRKYGAKNN